MLKENKEKTKKITKQALAVPMAEINQEEKDLQ